MSLILYIRDSLLRILTNFTSTRNLASVPAGVLTENDEQPVKSDYRLDNDSSDIITLPDGRQLGYAQYGSPTGRPIFLMHGLPGSRIDGAFFDKSAIKVGARLIAADRPGIGWSSPHPGRTLLDHSTDLKHLAEHLRLDSYSVMV